MAADGPVGRVQTGETLIFLTFCRTRSREKTGQKAGLQNSGPAFKDLFPLTSSDLVSVLPPLKTALSAGDEVGRESFVKHLTYKPERWPCCNHFDFGEKHNL